MERYSYFVHFTQITLIITPLLHSDLKYVERIVTFSLISLYSQVDKQRGLSLSDFPCAIHESWPLVFQVFVDS